MMRHRAPLRPTSSGVALPGALLAVAMLVTGCTAGGGGAALSDGQGPAATDAARTPDRLAEAFLTDWVDDGRVVRRDQGDDTVSEGQAYGLLLAAAIGDEQSFDSIWTWTDQNLMRPDGLLAWRWADGQVADDEPAADADLDTARALVQAGERFDRPDLTERGNELGGVVLDELTVETALGRILLPGRWAAAAEPYAYNPSYASPVAYAVLGRSSGDPRWAEVAAGSRAATAAALAKSPLPSDWAQIHADGTLDPMPGPAAANGTTGGDSVEYAYDAARLPIRYAESCDPADTALAAQLLPALDRQPQLAAQLDLGGSALTSDEHPVGYAARAASSSVGGDAAGARADLETADALEQANATYYGAAWAALSTQLLETDALGGCAPLAGSADSGDSGSAGSAAAGAAGAMQNPQLSSAAGTADAMPPVRVRIPSIGVDSGLESLTRDASGWIQPPADFASAGWYRDGVTPGRVGPAVIAGHIDSAVGPAVFYDLARLTTGDDVQVDLADGSTVHYRVDRSIQVPKNAFPTDEVYGPTPDAQLRLVTCGGAFDDSTGHYVDNVVVFATLTTG